MKNITRLRVLFFIRFLAESCFFPFISIYLTNKGYTPSFVGICIAIIPLTALVCAPIYSCICKRPKDSKRLLMLMGTIEPFILLLLMKSNSNALTIISVIGLGMTFSSNYGIIDSFGTLLAQNEGKNYSSVRIFGSISYAIGVFLASFIIKELSYDILFYIALVFIVSTVLFYIFVKSPEGDIKPQDKTSFKEIFKNKAFLLYLIFYVLFFGSMQVSDDFFSIYIKSKGSPDYIYNYVLLGFVTVEVVIMSLFKYWYKKIGNISLFIAVGVLVFRLILQSIPGAPVGLLIAAQILRGVSFSIILSVNSVYIVKLLGYTMATRGIIIATFTASIFASIFKLTGGYIIEAIGYEAFYLILCIVATISLLYFIIYYITIDRKLKKV